MLGFLSKFIVIGGFSLDDDLVFIPSNYTDAGKAFGIFEIWNTIQSRRGLFAKATSTKSGKI